MSEGLFKIVCVDSYARETRADALVCESIADKRLGTLMVEALQSGPQRSTDDWYRLFPANYRLCRGMKDLV